jgi:hypothetical protein
LALETRDIVSEPVQDSLSRQIGLRPIYSEFLARSKSPKITNTQLQSRSNEPTKISVAEGRSADIAEGGFLSNLTTPVYTGAEFSRFNLTSSLVFISESIPSSTHLPVPMRRSAGLPFINLRMEEPTIQAPLRPRAESVLPLPVNIEAPSPRAESALPLPVNIEALETISPSADAPHDSLKSGFISIIKGLVCKLGPEKVLPNN